MSGIEPMSRTANATRRSTNRARLWLVLLLASLCCARTVSGDRPFRRTGMAQPAARDPNPHNNEASQSHDVNGVPSEGSGDARMFFVPAGDDPRDYDVGPTVISINPSWVQNGNVALTFDVFLEKTAPAAVSGYVFSVGHATGGDAGSVDLQAIGGHFQVTIDFDRSDFIFANDDTPHCAFDTSLAHYPPRLACWVGKSEEAVAIIGPVYLGEMTYRFSTDAGGEFVIDFLSLGKRTQVLAVGERPEQFTPLDFIANSVILNVVAASCETDANCVDGSACTEDRCTDGFCDNTPRTYGDVNSDGLIDLADILCVLDGFQGVFNHCTLQDVDLSPCVGNGSIDLVDILKVLDAFADGPSPCPIQCP